MTVSGDAKGNQQGADKPKLLASIRRLNTGEDTIMTTKTVSKKKAASSSGSGTHSSSTAHGGSASTNPVENGNGDSSKNGAAVTTQAATVPVLNQAFAHMTVEELQQQLEAKKEAEIVALEEQLEKVQAEASGIEQRISMLRGVSSKRRNSSKVSRPRVRNERPLSQYLHEILKTEGGPLSVRQLEEKLGETDYKTEAKNKYVVIFTALTKNPEMFQKSERGKYEAI